ncbi:MAG: ribosome small subunit-dependent GTPase A [Lachnospiraceae bacterium]|nr:ribosome small subunit-dependent GTPase A [Lachnospiraceae bacterium]
MQGKIIRGIGGFYYVHISHGEIGQEKAEGIYECKAKGIFRNQNIKPLVGDNVEIEILDLEKRLGSIIRILSRKNALIRPAVANVDQAVVVFALSYPKPNLNLLDRFLLMMKTQGVPTVICFNKCDDQKKAVAENLAGNYDGSGSMVIQTSTVTGEGMDLFREVLTGRTTVLAGPSGVGKSSVMNTLFPEAKMETGDISGKIKRGKHTTRHSELFSLGRDTYIMDTPGFTSLRLPDLEKEEIKDYYPEFDPFREHCRFLGCMHINEPDCSVKDALEQGKISESRYENYKQFYEEISHMKKYK